MFDFKGVFEALIGFGVIIGLSIWGLWALIDWIFIDDSVKVREPLKPVRTELVIENNKIDTLYVYELP